MSWFMVFFNAFAAIECTEKIKRRENIMFEFLDVFSNFFSQ